MERRARPPALLARASLALLALGLGGGTVLLASSPRASRPRVHAAGPTAHAEALAASPIGTASTREPERYGQPRLVAATARGGAGEREFLHGFLRLAATPGTLEARAAAILDGSGPEPEKVALLRALRASGSRESADWHEHAVRSGAEASGPQGAGLASTALDTLLRDARDDARARAALVRLAFEGDGPSPSLRRRAAAALARHGDERDLVRLAAELARSSDPRLVDGALAALGEHVPSPTRTRVLLANGRSEAPPVEAVE